MKKMLPKEIYVRLETESNGERWLSAFEHGREAIEDDGPTTIGVYQLVRKIKGTKLPVLKPL